MNAIHRIRESVLGLTQAEMAKVAGVSQGTVSKWEQGALKPGHDEMANIRKAAADRGLCWDDSWFFESPAEAEQ